MNKNQNRAVFEVECSASVPQGTFLEQLLYETWLESIGFISHVLKAIFPMNHGIITCDFPNFFTFPYEKADLNARFQQKRKST
jgi:hypothetical protein